MSRNSRMTTTAAKSVLSTICWLVGVRSLSTLAAHNKGVVKLPQSFLLVEVGQPNDHSAAFLNWLLSFVHSSVERGKFRVTIKSKFVYILAAFRDKILI